MAEIVGYILFQIDIVASYAFSYLKILLFHGDGGRHAFLTENLSIAESEIAGPSHSQHQSNFRVLFFILFRLLEGYKAAHPFRFGWNKNGSK